MKLQELFSPHRPLIEPLEQRIAPALLVTGANLLGGAGNPTTGEGSIGGNSLTLVKVLSGNAIVWYDHGSIDAISVGPNTSLDITGNVGVIVANLTASGHLTDSDNNPANGLDGDVLLPNNIVGITTHPLSSEPGNVGEIITGGSISNLNISGNISGVYAGDGAFQSQSAVLSGGFVTVGLGVDVNPVMPGIQDHFYFAASNAQTVESGASITNVKIGAAEQLQMFAGSGLSGAMGKPGLPGGSISNVTIESAFVDSGLPANTPSYWLQAGAGGHGTSGGAGGSIQKIVEITSSGAVDIIAGQGGAGTAKAGGAGGSIKGLDMQSDSAAYTVHAGKGGAGITGGAGGSVTGVNFANDSPSTGIIVSAPFTGGGADDILLVDSGTGNMVIEQNDGDGSGFSPVIQDHISGLNTIASEGTTPVAAIAVDVNGDGLPDIVVAYKNTDNLGVFINQGGGVFYQEDFSGGAYTGDTLEASSVLLPFSPSMLVAGNFTGDGSTDIAVLAPNGNQTTLMTLTGNGLGGFAVPTSMIQLPPNAVGLTPADIQGKSYSDLIVGFKSGQIDSLLANGSTTGAPFNVVNSGITVSGGIANLDYNFQENILLALNATGSAVTTYTSVTSGALVAGPSINLSQQPGVALVAHFVPEISTPDEPIEVLSSISSGAGLDVWTPQANSSYTLTQSTQSTEPLKNFVPVIEDTTSGVAALGGSLGHFSFSQSGGPFYDVSLPFSGKNVGIVAGDGGNALGTGAAKAGAGGLVSGMNIVAGDVSVLAGNGGDSANGAAGAGGLVSDSPVLLTASGQTVHTLIEADNSLSITAGSGGSASGTMHAASGGAGGAVIGLDLSLLAGNIQVFSGDGGTGGGGSGGNGGTVLALESIDYGGDLSVIAGGGGSATGAAGDGGTGGSILKLTHTLTVLDQTVEAPYGVALQAGAGGSSNSDDGGAGGSVFGVNMTLQPPNESVNDSTATPPTVHLNTDSTLRVVVTAGDGGNGAKGGAGGSLAGIASTSVFNQIVTVIGATPSETRTFVEINPVTAQLTAGNGGNGAKAAGGSGGAISALSLAGISHYDPDAADPQAGQSPLVIISGNGGNGFTVGGAGGAITGIDSHNAQVSSAGGSAGEMLNQTELTGATVISGDGGDGGTSDGGAGGTITNLSIGVHGLVVDPVLTGSGSGAVSGGQLSVQSGSGGSGGAAGKGGAAGSIVNSLLGCADAFEDYGLLLQGGAGGSGGKGGGTGGDVINIQLNAPQNPVPTYYISNPPAYDVLSTMILAGNGGSATGGSAVGGTGGSISKIVENKDVNSSINLIQAGNGGSAMGPGGAGGSVSEVYTVGLIGQASDNSGNTFGVFQTDVAPGVFNTLFPGGVPEGVFAGRGGAGGSSGVAGSVTSINAAQIAAIGAAVDANGLFAAASKVANITAEVIGYDVNGNGQYDNVTGTNLTSPAQAVPIDGFVFSDTAPTGIDTANNTLLKAFTFIG